MLKGKVRRLVAISAAAPLLLASCSETGILDPFDDAAGTYQLTVFAGRSVPATFTFGPGETNSMPNGGTFQVTGGTLVLYNNGTFTETNHYITTPAGESSQQTTFVSSGTYTVNGTAFSLSAPAQNNVAPRFASGTLEFDTINYIEDDAAYEYKR